MNLESTILLVCSEDRRDFGTGFIVCQDRQFSYVVTCAHVIRDIKKNSSEVFVGQQKAKIVSQGKPDEIDLAILAIDKIPSHHVLQLASQAAENEHIQVAGLCQKENKSALVGEWISGVLEKEQLLTSQSTQAKGWRLAFHDEDRIEEGYSGGPVVHNEKVIGVAAIQLGQDGKKAIAISIDALQNIWSDFPQKLLTTNKNQILFPQKIKLKKKTKLQQYSWLVIRTSTIASLLIFICRIFGILELFELSFYDHSLRMRPPQPADNRLTIIEATTEDLNEQRRNDEDGKGAISDLALREVLEILNTDEYRPSVIALDLYRDFGESEPLQDLFEEFTQDTRVDLLAVCGKSNPKKDILGVSPPLETTIPINKVGFSNVILDGDNVLRLQIIKSQPLPNEDCQSEISFAFLAATQYLNRLREPEKAKYSNFIQEKDVAFDQLPVKSIQTNFFGGYYELDADGIQFLLNYRPVNRSLEEITPQLISLEEFRAKKVDPEYFKERIVLIGITSKDEAVDIFETPYGKTAGVVIHAHMISQLLDIAQGEKSQVWVWSLSLESLWTFVWAVSGSMLGIFVTLPKHFIIVTASGCLLIYGFGIGTMIFTLGWIPVIPPMLSFLITFFLVSFRLNTAEYFTSK